jgi:phenylpropionate dioxygenase-like ring-hydroxylating dioxygenase large terminal subunit
MFTHQEHLRHLLRPEHYCSEEHYRAELRHLFLPAWHPLATVHDLATPGDFLTFDMFETPILVRNFDGELRAFLNVCAHRHSRLTDKPRGHSDRLQCQYHGWEYDKDGRTGKVPEARAFRPWDRENACLKPLRVATCGEIVFVCLSESAPPLQKWLAPVWDVWSAGFAPPYRPAAIWEQDFPCNWKVVLENSLESYHIPLVHPKTFGDYPDEPICWHELDPRFTSFKTIPPHDFAGRSSDWIVRRLGGTVRHEYWHRVLHPHITESSLDVHRLLMCVFPTGPTTCRYRSILFTLHGRRPGPLTWSLARFLRWITIRVAKQVYAEDGSIYASVQNGLRSSPHPGVIGTREERVFHFQQYVLDGVGKG